MPVFNYKIEKRDLVIIAVIAVLSLLLHYLYFLDYKDTVVYPVLPYSDGYSYFTWARDIASADAPGSKAFMKWPLYAYLLGSLFKSYGSSITLVYFLQFFLGAINCILVFLIATVLFNRLTGVVAGILYLSYGLFLFYDGLLIYTSLSLCLNSFLFLYLLYLAEKITKRGLFLCGIILGLCTITQANIVVFGLIALGLILWQGHRVFLGHLAIFLCGLLLVIGAVTLRNYAVEHDFVAIAGNIGLNFYVGNNPDATGTFSCPTEITLNQDDMFRDSRIIAEASSGRRLKTSEVSGFWLNKAARFILYNPASFLSLTVKKMWLVLNPAEHIHEMEYYFLADKIRLFKILLLDLRLILPLALLGMIVSLPRFRELAFLYAAVVSLSLSIALFFVTTRYRMVVVPYLLVFAGAAVSFIWDALIQRKYRTLLILCSILIAIIVLLRLPQIVKIKDGQTGRLDRIEYHLSKASLYEGLKRYEEAARELELANSIHPDNKRVLFRLAVLRYGMSDSAGAKEGFKKIIALCPLCVDAYYNLGFLYNQEKRFNEARSFLERAVSLDPEDAGAHFELALAYKALNEPQKARLEFLASLERLSRWRVQERSLIEQELRGQ